MAANCLNCQCWSFVHGHRKISLGARGISCTGAPSVNKHTHAVTCLCHRMPIITWITSLKIRARDGGELIKDLPRPGTAWFCKSTRYQVSEWSESRGICDIFAFVISCLLHFAHLVIFFTSFTALLYFLFCEHLRHGSLEVDSLAARDRWQIPWRQTWKLSLVPLRVARGKWKKRFQIFHDISASNVRLTDDLTASHPAWEP
jgi:hypothetical protein